MKKIIFLLSLSFLFGSLDAYTLIEDVSNLRIETPSLADRKVRKLRLDNDLEVLLISDPHTPESGAAVAVKTGSWDDPKDRPGMAHFVEHMLFMGTAKYPEEESYTRYLDEHGGERNAFTMSDRTVYMFSINNDGFLGALDRFGQFFIEPLFNPSGVNRESKAIHQEFCKDIPLDFWRIHYVKKELANINHPYHAFCIGNLQTLAKISQNELKDWYKTHYSANLMHLVVYSSLDLDTLEKEVANVFSLVANRKAEITKSKEPIFSSDTTAKMIAIAPVQDLQILELSWELPRFFGMDKDIQADKIISHVLGHEGSSGLLAQLKKENLAEEIRVSKSRAGHDQCLFSLSIGLTSKGVKEYETVIARCFEAINSLKQSGVPRYIFDEVRTLEEMRYRFQSREEIFDLVSDYALRLVDEPLESFPQKTLLPTVFSAEKNQEFLAHLTPQTCQFTLIAQPAVSKFAPTAKEKWLGVDYTVVNIAADKLANWANLQPSQTICIPRPNPYIPESFCCCKAAEKSVALPKVDILENSTFAKVYTSSDDRFSSPEVSWTFRIKTPLISDASPKSQVMADLFCHAIKEKLNCTAGYEAELAGLSFSVEPKHYWIELKVVGFGDKASTFLQIIIQTIQNINLSRDEFALYLELYKREYANLENGAAVKQASELLWQVLYKNYPSVSQKLKACDSITYDQMLHFIQDVFKKCYIEGLFFGNLDKKETQKIWDQIGPTFKSKPYLVKEHPKIETAVLPENNPAFLIQQSSQPANALILTADCGPFSFKKRAALEILTKGLEEPFFSELRTKQQTAYLVRNWSSEIERHLYSFFAIQSSSHDTRDLLSRFELFLESSLAALNENVITKERFDAIRLSLIQKLENPAENMQKMGALLANLGFDYDGDFEWIDKRIQALKEISYDEFLEESHAFLGKENTKRLAVCIHGDLPTQSKIQYREASNAEKIRSEINYKSRS